MRYSWICRYDRAPQCGSRHLGERSAWCRENGDVSERDLTFLASQVPGRWFYLYLILDVYSRKIVGFEVHESDSSEHAVALLRRTALAGGLHSLPQKPVLRGDNGSTMKATTVLAMIHWLGLRVSHSRPRVSDDNAFALASENKTASAA